MKRFLAVVLAALIASPATAARYAGSDTAFPKTRVRGINLAEHHRVGAWSAATPECVWEISIVGLRPAAASTEYPLLDALNSVMAITDASGNVVREYQYDVYGARVSSTGSGPGVDRGFTGRYHDANGLIEHRDRLRNPATGYWLQTDRAGFVDGPNVFGFVRQNPANAGDPFGLATNPITKFVADYASSQTLTAALLYLDAAFLAEDPYVAAAFAAYANALIVMHLVAQHVASSPGLCKEAEEAERIAAIESRAAKLGLNVKSKTTAQLVEYWNRPVSEFIGKFRKGSITQAKGFPTHLLQRPLGEALQEGGSILRKLLTDSRFIKP